MWNHGLHGYKRHLCCWKVSGVDGPPTCENVTTNNSTINSAPRNRKFIGKWSIATYNYKSSSCTFETTPLKFHLLGFLCYESWFAYGFWNFTNVVMYYLYIEKNVKFFFFFLKKGLIKHNKFNRISSMKAHVNSLHPLINANLLPFLPPWKHKTFIKTKSSLKVIMFEETLEFKQAIITSYERKKTINL